MSFLKPYPQYKEADIPWLIKIPSGWSVLPLFSAALEKKLKNTGMQESNLLSLSYGKIVRRDIKSNEGLLPDSFETYQIVDRDDMVFRMTDLQNDQRSLRSALVPERGIITSAYIAVQPQSISPHYFDYLMRAYDIQKVFYSMGGGLRQSLRFEDMRRLPLVIPPQLEQKQIVDFLGKETSRIDTLIAKKTRFIELLKEKRQAVITKAVTKGLDDSVKMKDSGVEWIGEVPEYWEIKQLRHLGCFRKGLSITKADLLDDGVPCLNYGEVHSRYPFEVNQDFQPLRKVSEGYLASHPEARVAQGDFVFADTSEDFEGVGNFTLISGKQPLFAGYHTIIYKVTVNTTVPRFLAYYFESFAFRTQLRMLVKGVKVFSITQEILRGANIWLPPTLEQNIIADFLDRETSRIDILLSKTERSIELLKEKRSALITAAVTGKIDVREAA